MNLAEFAVATVRVALLESELQLGSDGIMVECRFPLFKKVYDLRNSFDGLSPGDLLQVEQDVL